MGGWLRGYRVLMAFSFRAAPLEAILFLLSGAVMSLVGPAMAFGAGLLVDGAVAGSRQQAVLAAVLLATAVAVGVINGLYYMDLLFSVAEKAGEAVDRRLIELLAGVVGLEHYERPDYLDRLDLLRKERRSLAFMMNATAGLLRVAVQLVASAVLLTRLHPALLLMPLVGVVSFVVGRRAQELRQRAVEATTELERLRRHLFDLTTSASAGKEVRVFGLAGELISRHHAVSAGVAEVRNRADLQGAGLQTIDALASSAMYVGAIGLVLVRAIQGAATPGDVVLAVGLAVGMNSIVFSAVGYGTHFLAVLRAVKQYLWLEDYAAHARSAAPDPALVPGRLVDGIDIQGVSFRYTGMDVAVLANVTLHLPAGSVVALVGENEAGKSTLVKLLCRFYEPAAGWIMVDGIDLRRFDVIAWRSRLATAFQDFVRFELLVREAVGVGDLPCVEDREAVAAALGRVGAGEVADSLPKGLETQLGRDWEGGVELSGGQWQKLALGRAMMRARPLLLILDEPTASLDAQAEHELFERYAQAVRQTVASTGTITILVSHRFSTVRMADRIVVLGRGCIVEQGSHDELMARGGLYAELYELQARAYR